MIDCLEAAKELIETIPSMVDAEAMVDFAQIVQAHALVAIAERLDTLIARLDSVIEVGAGSEAGAIRVSTQRRG